MRNNQSSYTLNNGVEIPCIGFGTWQTPNGDVAVSSIHEALRQGYRHVDTAAAYGNESSVGIAVKTSGISRDKLFITSKLANPDQGYKSALEAFDKSLRCLQLDYLDLYLIHWPVVKGHKNDWKSVLKETWRAFELLYEKGKVRAIGVSNFLPHHLDVIMENSAVKPAVNQIELHPGQNQQETVEFCRKNNMLVEAWSPLATGKMLEIDILKNLASKYNKSVAQICIRWSIQQGFLPLPKSVTPDRIKTNFEVFDFELSETDMRLISEMPYYGGSGLNPDDIDF